MTDISPEVRTAAAVSLGWLYTHPLRGCKVNPLTAAILDAMIRGEAEQARVLAAEPADDGNDGDPDQLALFDFDEQTGTWTVSKDLA